MKGGDSLQFSGKLTSSQHQCEDIILPAYSRYLQVLWDHRTCGNLFLTLGKSTGSGKIIRGKNSAQVWKRLKHITKLTGFKDIFLTSKHPRPPPTCLPHAPPPLSCIKIRVASELRHSKLSFTLYESMYIAL